MSENETHRCKSREGQPSIPGYPDTDTWRQHGDNTRTCSYCGSLHPDDALDIARKYVAEGVGHVDWTTKGYKVYLSRSGTSNASLGGIKFYTWHTPEGAEGEAHMAGINAAISKAVEKYREKYGLPSNVNTDGPAGESGKSSTGT